MPYPDDFSWEKFDAAMGEDIDWLEEDVELWNSLQELSKKLDDLLLNIPNERSYRGLRELFDTMRSDLTEELIDFEDDSTARAHEAAVNYEDYDPNDRYENDPQ